MSEGIPIAAEALAIDELLTAILSRCGNGDQSAKLGLSWVFLGNSDVRERAPARGRVFAREPG
ncbi:MAG: hypothetical protein ACYCOU_01640 [Sulfobacillus sp.]